MSLVDTKIIFYGSISAQIKYLHVYSVLLSSNFFIVVIIVCVPVNLKKHSEDHNSYTSLSQIQDLPQLRTNSLLTHTL